MSTHVSWFLENRIVLTYVWGDLPMDELKATSAQAQQLINVGIAPVHYIIDMLETKSYPTNLVEIMTNTKSFSLPNIGWVVLLSNDPVVKSIVTVSTGVAHTKYRAFANPQEALNFLKMFDKTLPELPVYATPV